MAIRNKDNEFFAKDNHIKLAKNQKTKDEVDVEVTAVLNSITIFGTGNIGAALTTSVSHAGEGALAYQWKKGGVDIGGATSSSYVPVAGDDGGSVTVTVTKAGVGSLTASPSVAIKYAAPAVFLEPSDISLEKNVTGNYVANVSDWFTGENLSYDLTAEPSGTEPAAVTLVGTTFTVSDDNLLTATGVRVIATNSGGSAYVTIFAEVWEEAAPPPEPINISGGTVETPEGSKLCKFTTDGTLTVTGTGKLYWKIVGGGAAGGYNRGGGGGGGEVLPSGATIGELDVVDGGTVNVVIGLGGIRNVIFQAYGQNGGDTVLTGLLNETAKGGGGGAANTSSTVGLPGANGGQGGGASAGSNSPAGGIGDQFNGGAGFGSATGTSRAGGAGGGAGGVGGSAASTVGGTGGPGVLLPVPGYLDKYVAAGGGGYGTTIGAGGLGGGGAGGNQSSNGVSAAVASIGCGGGGSHGSSAGDGTKGAAYFWINPEDNPIPDPELLFSTPPNLVVDPVNGLVEGGTLGISDGVHNGTFVSRKLYLTNSASDDVLAVGTEQVGWNFTSGTLTAGMAGKFPWGVVSITDGTDTLIGISITPGAIAAAPVGGTITLDEDDIEIVTMLDKGSGYWQPVFRITHPLINAADYDGYAAATGTKVRVAATHLDATLDVCIANAMYLIPGDYVESTSPLLTVANPIYTGANDYWRLRERPDQETDTGTWFQSFYWSEARQADVSDPKKRYIRIPQVSLDGGTDYGEVPDFTLLPVIPADPVDNAEEYWRPLEQSLINHPWYGYGAEYTRCQMFCEDFPQYVIAGGDMNGVHISDTMGRTWFHPGSLGLRCPAFNSVAIDPVRPQRLLAMGNMAWWSGKGNLGTNNNGIWLSDDLGETWTRRYFLHNASSDGFNQSGFCYDPATRASAVNSRTWWLVQRDSYTGGPAATNVRCLRSTDGGYTWTLIATFSVATMGRIFHVLHHPSNGCLYVATSEGLFKSNSGKTTMTLVTNGLPAMRVSTLEMSSTGATMYCLVRNDTNGGVKTSDGLYKSTDHGVTWAKVTTTGVAAGAKKRVAVNWKSSPERIWMQMNSAITVTSSGSAGPWTTCAQIGAPGWPSSDSYHRQLSKASNDTADGFDGIVCPKGPNAVANVCLINSVGRMHQTDDGVTFEDCCMGFSGCNATSAGGHMFAADPNNSASWMIAMQDFNVHWTQNRGRSFNSSADSIKYEGPDADSIASKGEMYTRSGGSSPGSSYSVCIARDGRWYVGFGDGIRQAICYSDDQGGTWDAVLPLGASGQNYDMEEHPTSNNHFMVGTNASPNRNFTGLKPLGGTFIGQFANGEAVISKGDHTQLFTIASNWPSQSTIVSTEFYSGLQFKQFGTSFPIARVSKSERAVWVRGPGKDVTRITNPTSGFGNAVVKSFPIAGIVNVDSDFDIGDICPDPNDPRYVYATPHGSGYAACVLRGFITINPSNRALDTIVWTNITYNAPKQQQQAVMVDPATGAPIIGGPVGSWMMKPPPGYQAANGTVDDIWDLLPIPLKVPAAS